MIGHHDRQQIDALRQAAAKKGRVVRVVDQKTAVVPLHADTLADPNIAGRGTVPEAGTATHTARDAQKPISTCPRLRMGH